MPTQKMRREKREREREQVCEGDRERDPWSFGASFYMFFPPPGPALCKLGQPGKLFVLPEVLTPVLRPSFVLFSRAFAFLVFQPLPFWTPVSYFNCLTHPTFRKRRSQHPAPSLHGKQMEKQWKQCRTLFFWTPKSLQMVIAAMKLKDAYSLEGKLCPTQIAY